MAQSLVVIVRRGGGSLRDELDGETERIDCSTAKVTYIQDKNVSFWRLPPAATTVGMFWLRSQAWREESTVFQRGGVEVFFPETRTNLQSQN